MRMDLVVIIPFGGYERGDHIVDERLIADALASNPKDVVQIMQGPDDPTPFTPSGTDVSRG